MFTGKMGVVAPGVRVDVEVGDRLNEERRRG